MLHDSLTKIIVLQVRMVASCQWIGTANGTIAMIQHVTSRLHGQPITLLDGVLLYHNLVAVSLRGLV